MLTGASLSTVNIAPPILRATLTFALASVAPLKCRGRWACVNCNAYIHCSKVGPLPVLGGSVGFFRWICGESVGVDIYLDRDQSGRISGCRYITRDFLSRINVVYISGSFMIVIYFSSPGSIYST